MSTGSPASVQPKIQNATTAHSSSPTSLASDIALLSQILSQDPNDDSDLADIAELLRKLEAADDLADGVEERLDGIIDNLDALLSDLETRKATGQTVETIPDKNEGSMGLRGRTEFTVTSNGPGTRMKCVVRVMTG